MENSAYTITLPAPARAENRKRIGFYGFFWFLRFHNIS
nr:MAG TPA: hypothetical protein [Caudoviricetes sp.]